AVHRPYRRPQPDHHGLAELLQVRHPSLPRVLAAGLVVGKAHGAVAAEQASKAAAAIAVAALWPKRQVALGRWRGASSQLPNRGHKPLPGSGNQNTNGMDNRPGDQVLSGRSILLFVIGEYAKDEWTAQPGLDLRVG